MQIFSQDLMDSEENQRLILTMTLYFIASEYVLTVIIAVLNMQAKNYKIKHINICIIARFNTLYCMEDIFTEALISYLLQTMSNVLKAC
jgi:hypothetical protein